MLAETLQGLAVLPLALSIASLRSHAGWNFELNAGVSALRGMRAPGLLVLLAVLMFGVGGVLQAAHYITGRWALLVISTACAVTFGLYRPKVLEHPGATRHSLAVRKPGTEVASHLAHTPRSIGPARSLGGLAVVAVRLARSITAQVPCVGPSAVAALSATTPCRSWRGDEGPACIHR